MARADARRRVKNKSKIGDNQRMSSRWRHAVCHFVFVLNIMVATAVAAADNDALEPLPDPITLEQALAFADRTHPDLALAKADVDRARSRLLEAEAETAFRSHIDVTPQYVEPATGGDSVDDSRVRLFVTKPLYDFGRSRSREDAAMAEVAGRELVYLDARQQRRVEIMTRFFDVLLADLRYAVDNENMAHKFVTYDRLREQHDLGQVSDVDLLEAESVYRDALIRRTESAKRQTTTRLQLAVALNRPNELPNDLVRPKLPGNDREIPDYLDLYEKALKANPVIAALRKEVEAAKAQFAAERARRRPVLSAEFEAADYQRELASRDRLRAGLNLRIPLYQGGEDQAAIARAAADLELREAKLGKGEFDLRQTVLNLVQELETLKVRRDAAKQRVAFRDLYLDRARALYEMEVQTSLGDALTRLTEAQWLAAKADFELALAWAKVDALTGKLVQTTAEIKAP